METIKKVSIDFKNPLYQQHIDNVHGANEGLRHIAIIDLQSGQALHTQSQGLSAEIKHDISVAARLFRGSSHAPDDQATAAAMDFLVLRFAQNYLIGYPKHVFGQACAVIPQGCSNLEQALQIACLDQPPMALGDDYYYELAAASPSSCPKPAGSDALRAFRQWSASSTYLQAIIRGQWPIEKLPDGVTDALRQLYYCRQSRCIYCLRSRFLTGYLTIMVYDSDCPVHDQQRICRILEDGVLRTVIEDILAAGISTDTTLVADTASAALIIEQLSKLDYDDLYGLLEVGGFANHSLGEQGEMEDGKMIYRCAECIYYHPNRKWCDLPELPVPVEPHWYCKVWRL